METGNVEILNCSIDYSDYGHATGDSTGQVTYHVGDIVWPWYEQNIYYPVYPNCYTYVYGTCEKSKIEQAFKVVQKLLEMKMIKEPKKIKDFVEVVNKIAEVL